MRRLSVLVAITVTVSVTSPTVAAHANNGQLGTDPNHLQVYDLNIARNQFDITPFLAFIAAMPGSYPTDGRNTYLPDVIALQEVGRETTASTCNSIVSTVATDTGHTYACIQAAGAIDQPNNARGGAAIIYRVDRLTVVNVKTFPLELMRGGSCQPDRSSDPWTGLAVRFVNAGGEQHATVATVHLPTQPGQNGDTDADTNPNAPDCTYQNNELVWNVISPAGPNTIGPSAVQVEAGDLNHPDKGQQGQGWSKWWACATNYLSASCPDGHANLGYNDVLYDTGLADQGTFSACHPRHRIDFILYHGAGDTYGVTVGAPSKCGAARYSDHLGLGGQVGYT